jgi:anthranilate synthase/aminodeoxychorismate synthase-like glutamine amidotransferase
MFLILDHYDSFSYNLARYFRLLGLETEVVKHDQTEAPELDLSVCSGLILSPGPGRPEQATTALHLLDRWAGRLPILGICLGHQIIAHYFSASVVRAPRPMHGYNSKVSHDGHGLFQGIPSPFSVTRYHSLMVDPVTLPPELAASAWSLDDGSVMALRHRNLAIESVQFHPEALMTEYGLDLIRNFAASSLPQQAGA